MTIEGFYGGLLVSLFAGMVIGGIVQILLGMVESIDEKDEDV